MMVHFVMGTWFHRWCVIYEGWVIWALWDTGKAVEVAKKRNEGDDEEDKGEGEAEAEGKGKGKGKGK